MSQTVAESAAAHVAASAHQASCATRAIVDGIENGVAAVRCAAKQSGDAAEEFLNDTTARIQRHPVLSLVATLVVGLGAGTLIGWMLKRR